VRGKRMNKELISAENRFLELNGKLVNWEGSDEECERMIQEIEYLQNVYNVLGIDHWRWEI
jgi:hypothetical protein